MAAPEILTVMMDYVRDSKNPKAVATATPEQMEFDSLDAVEFAMHLEQELDVDIPDDWIDENLRTKTFNDLAAMLAKKLEEA